MFGLSFQQLSENEIFQSACSVDFGAYLGYRFTSQTWISLMDLRQQFSL